MILMVEKLRLTKDTSKFRRIFNVIFIFYYSFNNGKARKYRAEAMVAGKCTCTEGLLVQHLQMASKILFGIQGNLHIRNSAANIVYEKDKIKGH